MLSVLCNIKMERRGGEVLIMKYNYKKILNLFKADKLSLNEAEKGMAGGNKDLPWPDDGKLRIVAYIGHKLYQYGPPNCSNIEVVYNGKALNVESVGSITCKNILQNATAGAFINCEKIGGNAAAGAGIRCNSIGGNAVAGAGINIAK